MTCTNVDVMGLVFIVTFFVLIVAGIIFAIGFDMGSSSREATKPTTTPEEKK